MAFRCQSICAAVLQAFELRLWPHQHPLRQFDTLLSHELLWKLEDRHLTMDRLQVCSFCLFVSVLGNGCKSVADSLWVFVVGLLCYMCTKVAQLPQVLRLGSMSDSMQVHSAARHLMAMKLYSCTVEVCEAPALRQHLCHQPESQTHELNLLAGRPTVANWSDVCFQLLQDMEPSEIGSLLRHPAAGKTIAGCMASFPALHMEAQLQPITRWGSKVVLARWLCASPSGLSWHVRASTCTRQTGNSTHVSSLSRRALS